MIEQSILSRWAQNIEGGSVGYPEEKAAAPPAMGGFGEWWGEREGRGIFSATDKATLRRTLSATVPVFHGNVRSNMPSRVLPSPPYRQASRFHGRPNGINEKRQPRTGSRLVAPPRPSPGSPPGALPISPASFRRPPRIPFD